MAIFIDQDKRIKNIFVNVNGEKKSISSAWVNRDGIPTKVFQIKINHDPHAANRIKIGTTETRVIAGQELEFICIDNAYVDATGYEKGALFIAKDFISGNTLTMGVIYSNLSVSEWLNSSVRRTLNGETSDLSNLVYINTTVTQKYSSDKTTTNYDMEAIDSYGTTTTYDSKETLDRVFILSLEEAIKYNKVMIDDKEISVIWDLDCDGEIDMISGSSYRYGYYLRTLKNNTYTGLYVIDYSGKVMVNKGRDYGIRPCYVKPSGYHVDEDGDNICDICGHKHIWEENIDDLVWEKVNSEGATQSGNDWKIAYGTAFQYAYVDLSIKVPKEMDYTINYSFIYGSYSDWFSLSLDGSQIIKTSSYGSNQYTLTLTEGTHTIRCYVYKGGSSSNGYATITMNPISIYNHKCSECEIKENHIYEEKVTKEPTCTEKGEKELTCVKCGYSYIEEIPENGGPHIDENGDDVCDKCGHIHIWEENVDSASWAKNATQSTSLGQSGNRWTLNYSSATQYTKFTSHGTWDIEVPMDIEYSFDYGSGSMWTSDRVRVYLDDELLVDFSDSSKSGTETILLTAGKHTLQMYLNKNNTTTSATYATITLNPIEMLNHICTECGEKMAHHYADGIVTKESTCTEKGEKEFVCTKCNATKTEEIEALGHHYVDGVCDRCGSLNLVSNKIWSASASTSTTTDSGGGHYDKTTLIGTYSPNIEITEDMREGEYLLLDFYVRYPFYGGAGHYGEVDGINGQSMLQRYDEETGTWETVYSYNLSYQTVGTYMKNQEGSYGSSSGDGIMKVFQLEKGTYRVYGRFTAARGCSSNVAHYYYSYEIKAIICQLE